MLGFVLALGACASAAPPDAPVLPRLEMPESAVLMFESTPPADPDRSAGWRFYLDRDGCYFVARNEVGLFVDGVRLGDDDPDLFWNTSFPPEPLACLDPQAMTRIQARIDRLRTVGLPAVSGPDVVASDAETARWTFLDVSGPRSVQVVDPNAWTGAPPTQRLRAWYRLSRNLADLHAQVRTEVEAVRQATPRAVAH